MRIVSAAALVVALAAVPSLPSSQDEEPTKWDQLFFPFPIVGAPPQLEQQVQFFNSYFRGKGGSGDVPSAELAYIASPHLGLVATVPFQIGFGGQTTGFEDAQLLVQWLAAGSLELDDMLSVLALFRGGTRDEGVARGTTRHIPGSDKEPRRPYSPESAWTVASNEAQLSPQYRST